ncbi:hypothetical protein SYK_06960 [Pseudodesulfovibrio nedwellii]|uniref:LPS export ABC transporter periplasmic protein LptC n=1 Tax=Pseudodesulfovibrio nedwellii TaxID=2973072 RepID=A0ABM8AYB8_9BACT|nr:hypothetical protein [Pseudodesulfovibrio nedwellii]BDQ36336.1 hypothetical protein SYK_06960 [Pseudodesulfovibrio nedwellii]
MNNLKSFKLVILVAVCSFLGGIVGGWMSQSGSQEAMAKQSNKLINADYDILSANKFFVRKIYASSVEIVDEKCKPVVHLFYNAGGGGTLQLGVQSENEFKSMASMSSQPTGTSLLLKDQDFDDRIDFSTYDRIPMMNFNYNGKARLTLGTNSIITKSTGDTHQINGSVYTFDRHSDVTSRLPAN